MQSRAIETYKDNSCIYCANENDRLQTCCSILNYCVDMCVNCHLLEESNRNCSFVSCTHTIIRFAITSNCCNIINIKNIVKRIALIANSNNKNRNSILRKT